MTITYDTAPGGKLVISVTPQEQTDIDQAFPPEQRDHNAEWSVLSEYLQSSELDWVHPSETGDLTDAPLLGIRGDKDEIIARWGYMDYQVRSFLDDLIDNGKAVFVSEY